MNILLGNIYNYDRFGFTTADAKKVVAIDRHKDLQGFEVQVCDSEHLSRKKRR